jgi:hypothetical protein
MGFGHAAVSPHVVDKGAIEIGKFVISGLTPRFDGHLFESVHDIGHRDFPGATVHALVAGNTVPGRIRAQHVDHLTIPDQSEKLTGGVIHFSAQRTGTTAGTALKATADFAAVGMGKELFKKMAGVHFGFASVAGRNHF